MTPLPFPLTDVHAHLPVVNTTGRDEPTPPRHPPLEACAHERQARTRKQRMRRMPYPLALEDLSRAAFETTGPERALFGADPAAFPRGFAVRYLHDPLRACYARNLPEGDVAEVFGGNAARLVGFDPADASRPAAPPRVGSETSAP